MHNKTSCPNRALIANLYRPIFFTGVVVFVTGVLLRAEDWPEWRGKGRQGVWTETGILEKFPDDGLKLAWRVAIGGGFAGPAVAQGRVYVTDYFENQGRRGIERALCLDEKTGEILWTYKWEANYNGIGYPYGPRATPTVDGQRVYILGSRGVLLCLNAKTGQIIWERDYVKDYDGMIPIWGAAAAPLVDGARLISIVGGRPDAKVVAFNKDTGEEIWRALSFEGAPGYSAPFMIEAGGTRQLIIWHPQAVASLDPETGDTFWEYPFKVHAGMTVTTPVLNGHQLLVSSFYEGSKMFRLDRTRPHAELLWKGSSNSEIRTDGLHALVTTPLIQGDYIYGICSYGQFRCLNAKTGERVWETMEVTLEHARWASGFITRHHERVFVNNDRGDLIIAKLSPEGYQEIARTKLIKSTTPPGRRRELGAVNWSHPAYANRHIIARNDEEIVRYSLAREDEGK